MFSVARRRAGAAPSKDLSPAQLAAQVNIYLGEHATAAILEDGRVLFDLRLARYAVTESHGRCVLQLWSEERNVVRTVIGAEQRTGCLRLMTRRLGAVKPTPLELVPTGDQRTPTAREAGRRQYLRLLERVLQRAFPDWQVDAFRSAADLQHSFGPAYARGRFLRGLTAHAVIGVGAEESPAAVDGVLTLGILWLDYCREHSLRAPVSQSAGNAQGARSGIAARHYSGLKVIVPAGAWRTTAERMAWLNHGLAEFSLFALEERSEELTAIEFRDSGNVTSRLVHAFDVPRALHRAQPGVARVTNLLPADANKVVELRARSAAEVGLLIHGLEFARVRNGTTAESFAHKSEITFGAGAKRDHSRR